MKNVKQQLGILFFLLTIFTFAQQGINYKAKVKRWWRQYSVGGGSEFSWVATDPLFEIGDGLSDASRSNAFIIFKNGNATLAGTLTENSDRRLKTEITELDYGLETVLRLNPVSYYWKRDRESRAEKTIGLIAQDVKPLLGELVRTGHDKEKTLSLDYTGLIPVLINAIKEQQEIIGQLSSKSEKQQSEIKALQAEFEKIKSAIGVN